MRRKAFTPRGFTLVELLVVMGIAAALVAMLLPALTRARQQSGAVKCMSNLRQIGLALTMYRLEFRDYLPMAANPQLWSYQDILQSQVRQRSAAVAVADSMFWCPAQQPHNPAPIVFGLPAGQWPGDYTVNYQLYELAPAVGFTPMRAAKVHAIDTIFLLDGSGAWADPSLVSGEQVRVWARHAFAKTLYEGNVNVLFVDAHVEIINWNRCMTPALWTPQRD